MARSIIVGDVHGCSAELLDLLDRVQATEADRVVFVGDLVARGPDTPGVLATVRRIAAKSVIGNHEARLLRARKARARGEELPRLGLSHRRVMAELSEEDWELLEGLPYHLELPEHGVLVVHAGLMPNVPIHEQDPVILTHMRSIDSDGEPSERPTDTLWGVVYQGPPHVVFGHNAIASIQIHEHATGLDSGCVYGGALTALVLPRGQPVPAPADRRDWMVSVAARQPYYHPRKKGRYR